MSPELTSEKMKFFFPSWLKPLSDEEITDFLQTPYQEEKRLWYPEWPKNLPKIMSKNSLTKHYKTQKEIKKDIKILNEKLNWWMIHKRTASNEITKTYCDLHLEEYHQEKEKLQKKLGWMKHLKKSANVAGNENGKITNQDIIRAKSVPITDIYQGHLSRTGNRAKGHCPFHSEKTASFTIYLNQNKWHCFGSCGTGGDVIDFVVKQEKCDFIQAVKKLLHK